MSRKRDRKHVKSSLDIAMQKAKDMPKRGVHEEEREARIPEGELKDLREKAGKAGEYYERMLRVAAELENYKKRAERERADLLKYGQEELVAELLTVMDNFERAMSASGSAKDVDSLVDGVKLIQKQLLSVLKKNGVEPIEAVGKPFNPELHEAISQVETDDHPDGTVIAEQLRGYTMNGRLLRPSAVTVSKSPGGDED